MPRLTIDNQVVEVEPGATILDAAQELGIQIPTLCYLPGLPPATSCMVCVVRVNGGGRLLPACATAAAEGMAVESETEEVRDARRTALELLLSDHLGDCAAPCQIACPAHIDIPAAIRHIAAGRPREAIITIKERAALPAILGRLCAAPCERACRRAQADGAVAICPLKRFAADADLASAAPYAPECRPATGKRVAIVGAGPAGLSAAYYLLREGHACVIFDAGERPGGALRDEVREGRLAPEVLDAEVAAIARMGAELRMGARVGNTISLAELREQYAAVLIATGSMDEGAWPELDKGPHGIHAEIGTRRTSLPGVFAAGMATGPSSLVRAVARGRAGAFAVSAHLAGSAPAADHSLYSVHMGRLGHEELALFLETASQERRVEPAGGTEIGFDEQEARRESLRCLHCDCLRLHDCRLRHWSIVYGAQPTRFHGERRRFERDRTHPAAVYESGKCIACGLCVQIAERAREPLGLTFVGRSFNVRTRVPFNETLDRGLTLAARECVDACPAGALAAPEEPAERETGDVRKVSTADAGMDET